MIFVDKIILIGVKNQRVIVGSDGKVDHMLAIGLLMTGTLKNLFDVNPSWVRRKN